MLSRVIECDQRATDTGGVWSLEWWGDHPVLRPSEVDETRYLDTCTFHWKPATLTGLLS